MKDSEELPKIFPKFLKLEMWWLIGSAPDFRGTGPGFESTTMILMRCRIWQDHCHKVENLRVEKDNLPLRQKKIFKKVL